MDQNVVDRSPSPLPLPPTPSAPGPRATALQKLYSDATAHVLKTCSYTHFSACFPTPAQQVPASMRLLHEHFTEKLGESMGREFESILEERGVVGGLNGLDLLIEEGRRRREQGKQAPVPPHTLPAQQLYLASLAPSLSLHSRDLHSRQETLQNENVELLGRVMQQRKDIEGLVKGLENVVGDLDASVASLQSEDADVDGLRDEVREVDEEMRVVV